MSLDVAPNPFEITKATDLSDEQIEALWVDFGGKGGFYRLADPRSPMPRLLLGGKGGGRTHLMRYFSAKHQQLRAEREGRSLLEDGYIGIYLRLGGLNSGRFEGKGIEPDIWRDVFAYALDLDLAETCLETAQATFGGLPEFRRRDAEVAGAIVALFDTFPEPLPTSIAALLTALRGLRSEVDLHVNNAAIRRHVNDVEIRVTRGRLVFAIPRILSDAADPPKPFIWLYLLDELENITEEQQRYVQTLVREKEPPTSLMLGSRLYGFRTRMTYSADEENKEDSEYRVFRPDATYIEHFSRFKAFCAHLVAQRLITSGFDGGDGVEPPKGDDALLRRRELAAQLPHFFVEYETSLFGDEETAFVAEAGGERHLTRLAAQLAEARFSPEAAASVVDALRVPGCPLVEQYNVFAFYQAWSQGSRDLPAAARRIGRRGRALVAGRAAARQVAAFRSWRSDLLAQLLFIYERKQRYLGFDTFVRMSAGLPRHLVVILNNIYRQAVNNGELPFSGQPISELAQRKGVAEASNWFYADAKPAGRDGETVQESITRLADLFRGLRYSDKPVEVGLTTFAVNASELTEASRKTLRVAVEWSMLITRPSGRRDKNTRAVLDGYQLSPMLCPRWDLPLVRRGVMELSGAEANAIFDPSRTGEFAAVRRARIVRVSAPFRSEQQRRNVQPSLLGDG